MRKLGKRHEQIFVMVATPSYQGKSDEVFRLSSLDAQALCSHADRVGLTSRHIKTQWSTMGNGAFIELARNSMVKTFLDSDCTHLFFIDGDLQFESRAFVGALIANKPIVAGAYRRREEVENYPVMLEPDPKTGGPWMVDGGFILCKRVATGFLCIRRDVIEDMVADPNIGAWNHLTQRHVKKVIQQESKDYPEIPWLFYTKFDEKDRFVGEDFAFCDDYVKKYGEFIPVWPDWDFKHGGFAGNLHNFLNEKADAALKIINKPWAPTVPHIPAESRFERPNNVVSIEEGRKDG